MHDVKHPEIWLIRHGETEWSKSGQHTSKTNLPLTTQGEARAVNLGRTLANHVFAKVFVSPMQRAQDTARLAGMKDPVVVEGLMEWDYGKYEGLTTHEIQAQDPGWTIWHGVVPGGETGEQVAARADKVIQRAVEVGANVALFAHGHILRVLGARWLGMPAEAGKYLALSTATFSILGYEHEQRVLQTWNQATG